MIVERYKYLKEWLPPNAAQVLGVPQNASKDVVDKAYRQKIKQAHPDNGGSNEAASQINAAHDAYSTTPQNNNQQKTNAQTNQDIYNKDAAAENSTSLSTDVAKGEVVNSSNNLPAIEDNPGTIANDVGDWSGDVDDLARRYRAFRAGKELVNVNGKEKERRVKFKNKYIYAATCVVIALNNVTKTDQEKNFSKVLNTIAANGKLKQLNNSDKGIGTMLCKRYGEHWMCEFVDDFGWENLKGTSNKLINFILECISAHGIETFKGIFVQKQHRFNRAYNAYRSGHYNNLQLVKDHESIIYNMPMYDNKPEEFDALLALDIYMSNKDNYETISSTVSNAAQAGTLIDLFNSHGGGDGGIQQLSVIVRGGE